MSVYLISRQTWKCENRTALDLIELVKSTQKTKGGWNIFTFHGIGEGHLSIETDEFTTFCRFLEKEQESVWTAPLIQVAYKLDQWRRNID